MKILAMLTIVDLKCIEYLGDNCIQIFHLGKYIVGYTVESLVLR